MSSAIVSHETRGDVPPYPDTKVTLAFGDEVFPMLVVHLRSPTLEVVQSALGAGNRLLPTAINTVKAVAAGAIPEYARLCKHTMVDIRRAAATALEIAFVQPQAREAFAEGKLLDDLRASLHDSDSQVQETILRALAVYGATTPFANILQAHGYVREFIALARDHESKDVKYLALHALVPCVNHGTPGQLEAIECGAIPVLIELFGPSYGGRIREEGAHVLALLCFLPQGKAAAVAAGAVLALNTILQDRSASVRTEASGVAMALSIDDDAKLEFVNTPGALGTLVKLLSDAVRPVRLNTLRAVAALSANPDARSLLRGSGAVEVVKALASSGDSMEAGVAGKTLAVLEWHA